MKKTFINSLFTIFSAQRGGLQSLCWLTALLLWGCIPKASDKEIEQMCVHLAELRNKPNDTQMRETCIREAKVEGVSQKQARCRIYAVNKVEYWVRCRTGEARIPASAP